jgi:universal stress protein A
VKVQQILVPVDFSALSSPLVEYAAIIARSLHASIILLHMCEPPDLMAGIVPGVSPSRDLEAQRQLRRTNMQSLVQEAKCLEGIPFTFSIQSGYATPGILQQARIRNVDLILMGTHGRAGLDRWLMGSVAQGVMHKATCPVLILHSPGLPLGHGIRIGPK